MQGDIVPSMAAKDLLILVNFTRFIHDIPLPLAQVLMLLVGDHARLPATLW